jgi:NTF2-like N-terminal transpeptidase domain
VRRRCVLLVPLVVAASVAACSHSGTSPQQAAAQRFLDALGRDDVAAAAAATSDRAGASSVIATSLKGLGKPTGTLRVTSQHGTTAQFRASWSVPGVSPPWIYQGTLQLTNDGGAWTVVWTPSALHPGLAAGQHLFARRTQPPRAAHQDATGRPLFAATPVVYVGIEPSQVKSLDSPAATLAATLHISAGIRGSAVDHPSTARHSVPHRN